ncbi:hypothetical protein QN277_020473 [Acacia crassicarpa]|uniref:Uncharacterized protein n=1 Tax=Acacia crassicarpa TaxID=499986 RepID=A0AAE1MPE5_9FABA|nr:hypothetical protein QN277_020473 [Acacia crassicarpa]
MNSSGIKLCQSPLPVAPSWRFCSASRAHVSLSPVSKPSHLVSSSRLHRFSELEREKKKNDMMRGGSLAMASNVFGAFSLSVGKMKNKATVLASSAGDDQFSNPVQVNEGSVTGPLKKQMTAPSFFENEPDDNEIEALKLYAMAVSNDDPKGAQEILSKEREHWEEGEADDKLLMALVELLVYQEDYDEASSKLEELRKVVKADKEQLGTSDFMHTKWKKFYLLKAIVESVNEAREKIKPKAIREGSGLKMEVEIEDEDEDDTDKPKEELWLIYCRKHKYLHQH